MAELRLTTLMVTHSMHQALSHGDRLLMLHEGRICLDVAGEAKARLGVEDLLAEFRRRGGAELDDDALLLGRANAVSEECEGEMASALVARRNVSVAGIDRTPLLQVSGQDG